MADVDTNALVEAAKCFRCLPQRTQLQAQTYILAYAYNVLGTDPDVLAALARELRGLSHAMLLQIRAYLLASAAGGSTDPNVVAEEAKCRCIPGPLIEAVNTYLLTQEPAGPGITDPSELAEASHCFCLPPDTLLAIQCYILAASQGMSTTAASLAAAAKCWCLSVSQLREITTHLIDYLEDNGGVIGGGGGCVDVYADLTPVITGTYTDGVLTAVDITFPKVCCNPQRWYLYESDSADMSGNTVLAQGTDTLGHGGEANYVVNVDLTGTPPTKAYVAALQECVGPIGSQYSNVLATEGGPCGAASTIVVVSGAGDPDADGTYSLYQTTETTAFFANTNGNDWEIHFQGGALGIEAEILDDIGVRRYELDATECFPCGTWEVSILGTGPAPTARWGTDGEELASEWADRVVTNGGARPSNSTIAAASTFWASVIDAGIDPKIKTLNFIAPDSLIAAITPFIVGGGIDPWTNGGPFLAGDLTVNGLLGDGSTKVLDTGLTPGAAFSSTASNGLTCYRSADTNHTIKAAIGSGSATDAFTLWPQGNNFATTFDSLNFAGGRLSVSPSDQSTTPRLGYFSGNRIAANNFAIYFASSTSAHAAIATAATSGGVYPANSIHAYGQNSPSPNRSEGRFSFFAVHEGLTQAESLALYNAVQALRTTFGGGYV